MDACTPDACTRPHSQWSATVRVPWFAANRTLGRQSSSGTRTSLVVEIDNRSSEEVYGFDAVLVGSDRRSAEVVYSSSDYPADAITDDVLVFNGIDLTDGGELRIAVDFDTTLVVEVPAVPPVEEPT